MKFNKKQLIVMTSILCGTAVIISPLLLTSCAQSTEGQTFNDQINNPSDNTNNQIQQPDTQPIKPDNQKPTPPGSETTPQPGPTPPNQGNNQTPQTPPNQPIKPTPTPPTTEENKPIKPTPPVVQPVQLNVNLQNLSSFLENDIFNKGIVFTQDAKNILESNKSKIVKLLNDKLNLVNLKNITVDQTQIKLYFDNVNLMQNTFTNPSLKFMLKTQNNEIIISNINFINKEIISNNEQLVQNNSYKPKWDQDDGGFNEPKYNIEITKNQNFNGDRTKFKNIKYYTSELVNQQGFPGFPSFSNSWGIRSSSNANKIIKSQIVVGTNDYNQVMQSWTERLCNEENHYLDPNFIYNEIKNNTFKKYGPVKTFGNFDVNYDQPAVSKTFRIPSFYPNNFMTGLYAPAGEVITLKIPKQFISIIKSMNIKLKLGFEWFNYMLNRKNYTTGYRLPYYNVQFDLNWLITQNINSNNYSGNDLIVKFGTPVGGTIVFDINSPIGFGVKKEGDIKFTIEGAIEYAHYIDGYTTDEEWFRLVNETNVPVFTVQSPHLALFKPWFHGNNNNDLKLKNGAKKNSPKYHLNFYDNVFKISSYISSVDLGYTDDDRLRNQTFTCNDYVPAGYACNIGKSQIILPIGELDGLFNESNSLDTGATNDWCIEHEGNHSYEREYYLFNNWIGESWNNVANILANACMADETYFRDKCTGWWSHTNSSYAIIDTKKVSNNWSLTGDNIHNTYTNSAYIHSVGTKFATDVYRKASYLRKYLNGQNVLATKNGNYSFSALSYLLLCETPKVNMLDFILNTTFKNDGGLSNNSNIQREFEKVYNSYIKNLPVYHPVGNYYSSGPFIPTNKEHTTWEYGGDTVRPYLINYNSPTHFDMKKYTKFTNLQNDKLATLKSIKIVNQPKYGTVKIDNNKLGFTYTPNLNAKVNDMDEIIVEIQDSFNELNRILIRPQFYVNNTYIDDIIDFNLSEQLFGQPVSNYLNGYNTTNIRKFVNSLPTLAKSSTFITNKSETQGTEARGTKYLVQDANINKNQLRHIKFYWKANETGYYRINFDATHSNRTNLDYGIVSELTEQNKEINPQEILWNNRWLGNGNDNRFGHYFEDPETKVFRLEKNKIYAFDFINLNLTPKDNPTTTSTMKKIAINYLGNKESDKSISNIDYNKQPLQSSFVIAKSISYQNTLEQLNKDYNNLKIKKYYWFVENSNLFNSQYDLYPINLAKDTIIDKSISSLTNASKVSLTPDSDGCETDTVQRFLSNSFKWTQFWPKKSQNKSPTKGGFNVTLNQPITFRSIKIKNRYKDNSGCQKVRLTDLDTNKIIYDDLVDNWWNANASISFSKDITLKHFRIEFFKAVDKRGTTPKQYQDISANGLYGWLILYNNPLTFSSFENTSAFNVYKYMDYGYSIYNKNIQLIGPWNETSNNAIWESKQLISRYNGSRIKINIDRGISKVAIIGDQFKTKVEFNVYVNNKFYGTYNNQNPNPLITTALCQIDLDKNINNQILIEVVNNNSNNPFSFQGITLKK